MILDPILIECWITALCAYVNAAPAHIHGVVVAGIVTWEWRYRPRA